MKYPTQEYVEKIKEQYPIGTVIELTADMDDRYSPIVAGTQGEVVSVDDMGTLHMKWQNGRSLGVVPYEDSFKVISKPVEQILLTADDTLPSNKDVDFTNQTVIIKPSSLNEEHRIPRNQIWVATHGPGCRASSFTGTVHLKHPIDKDTMCVHRNEILGMAKPEVIQEHLAEQEQTAKGLEMGGMSL